MKTIYFTGKAGDGKTAAALGIGLKLREKGLKVSYFKPLGFQKGIAKKEDDDVLLMREVFELPFSSDVICPVTLNPHYLTGYFLKDREGILPRLDDSFNRLKEGYDVLLIDGSVAPHAGYNQGFDDFSLAKRWGAGVIYVLKADCDFDLDQGLLYSELWDCRNTAVIGALFNNISRTQLDKTEGVYKPILEKNKMDVLGIVPRMEEITTPTVAEFYSALNGEILAAPDKMNRPVEDVVVGSMTIESALGYLRRAPNKALITGGDRSDMALTALETNTSVIIFTGGLYPNVRVLARAEEKGVPVILVHEDTYTTVESLHSVYRSIHPDNEAAIKIVKKVIDSYVDWQKVLDYVEG
ncbi:MAG TPA: phosphotransacetylase family protein [Firmicutes bacterium]|jgi:BioD-like phosphotransacetylase family protein|nr:phosphotransacetylase family protein [Bacillota bacterium]